MKILDIIYVSIYDWYNRMKLSGRKVNPSAMVSLMMALSVEGWVLLAIEIYSKYLKYKGKIPFLAVAGMVLSGLVVAALIDHHYSKNDRYLEIYNNYLSLNSKEAKKRNSLYAFCVLLSPYFLSVVFMLAMM